MKPPPPEPAFQASALGRADLLGSNNRFVSRYPGSIFSGWAKILLFTLIPAGFVAHVPVELLREFDPAKMGLLLAFTGAIWVVAIWVFQAGLRRYESGNLIGMRG